MLRSARRPRPSIRALKPGIALALFAAFVLLLVACAWLTKYGFLYRLSPLTQSPEVLRARAHEIITRVGFSRPFHGLVRLMIPIPTDESVGYFSSVGFADF